MAPFRRNHGKGSRRNKMKSAKNRGRGFVGPILSYVNLFPLLKSQIKFMRLNLMERRLAKMKLGLFKCECKVII